MRKRLQAGGTAGVSQTQSMRVAEEEVRSFLARHVESYRQGNLIGMAADYVHPLAIYASAAFRLERTLPDTVNMLFQIRARALTCGATDLRTELISLTSPSFGRRVARVDWHFVSRSGRSMAVSAVNLYLTRRSDLSLAAEMVEYLCMAFPEVHQIPVAVAAAPAPHHRRAQS